MRTRCLVHLRLVQAWHSLSDQCLSLGLFRLLDHCPLHRSSAEFLPSHSKPEIIELNLITRDWNYLTENQPSMLAPCDPTRAVCWGTSPHHSSTNFPTPCDKTLGLASASPHSPLLAPSCTSAPSSGTTGAWSSVQSRLRTLGKSGLVKKQNYVNFWQSTA